MNSELLQIIEFLEQERDIKREVLFEMVEGALINVMRKEYFENETVLVAMNRDNGAISASAQFLVVEKIKNPQLEKTVAEVCEFISSPKVGQFYTIPLPATNIFSRVGAKAVKQVINQKIREVEKSRVREEYADKIGQLITGTVRTFEKGDTYIDFGRAEGVMPFNEKIRTEEYQNGDLITTILLEIDDHRSGASLTVSRSHPNLAHRLFENEVPEIGDGAVIIKGLSRDAGFRTKIAVQSTDSNVDAVGSCVGVRGARVRAIMRELGREKIDIMQWNDNVEILVVEALKPAKIIKTELDEKEHTIIVYADSSQYSLAIGRRGQNARLVSQLVGWKIKVLEYENDNYNSMEDKMQNVIDVFSSIPGLSSELAQALVSNGYLSLGGLKEADVSDLIEINGIDESFALKIIDYARDKVES